MPPTRVHTGTAGIPWESCQPEKLQGAAAAGKQLDADAVLDIGRALAEFSAATGIGRATLAPALGLVNSDLTPSRLRRTPMALFWKLRDTELIRVAERLHLDAAGLQALQQLARRVQDAVCGRGSPQTPDQDENGLTVREGDCRG